MGIPSTREKSFESLMALHHGNDLDGVFKIVDHNPPQIGCLNCSAKCLVYKNVSKILLTRNKVSYGPEIMTSAHGIMPYEYKKIVINIPAIW